MGNHASSMFVEAIKQLAVNAVNSGAPTQFTFGVVETVNPLSIRLNQKMVLPDAFLILTNAVKDHSVDITVSWKTVDDDYLSPNAMVHTHSGGLIDGYTGTTENFNTTHHHDIKGRKKITIHNGLTVGEMVLLLRVQGGQSYVVIDRVDEIVTTGEDV